MPDKAPPPLVTPYYDWTGFYLGGNVGYSVSRDPTTVRDAPGLTASLADRISQDFDDA